jgi:hypothetical protein
MGTTADGKCESSTARLAVALYGLWRAAWPSGVGVHEFQSDYWHLLSPSDASARVTMDATDPKALLVDVRR